jgi:tetratricopeptide (TPR) repeat protein
MDPIGSPPPARDGAHALSRLATAPFLGRNALLSALRVHLEQAARGQGRGILLLGEPGIGKTRCADEVARAAAALGMQGHFTRCHETEGAPGLWPWVQLAEALCACRDEGSLREILEPDLVALAPLLPAEARRLSGADLRGGAPESEARYRLFEALTGMLRRAAGQQPLLLVIDDLQWADPASVLLARFVLREVRQAPIALLCLYRDSEILSEHPLAQPLADLAAESAAFRLDGLAEEDVARFMEHVAGFEVADVLTGAVHAQTGGNPLFLVEVVRLLATEDRLGGPGATPPASAPLPSTVRHTVQRRVASLHPNTRRVLQSATAIGNEFDREILEYTDPAGRDELTRALDEACEARILQPVAEGIARFRFAHHLIREAIYESLPGTERARLHRGVGEAIVSLRSPDLGPHFAELSHHFLIAAPTGTAALAAGFAERGAREAARIFSFEGATQLYEQALRAVDLARADGGDATELERLRCRVRVGLGEVLWQRGERRAARDQYTAAIQAARELGDAALLARAAIGVAGRNDLPMGLPDASVNVLEEALEALPRDDSRVRVRVLANLVRVKYFGEEREQVQRWAEEAVARAERIGHPGTLFAALEAMHYALLVPEGLEQRLRISARLPGLARRSGSIRFEALAHLWRVVDLLELPDVAGADAEIASFERLAREMQQPFYRWLASGFRATRAQMEGRLSEAEQLMTEALRSGGEADSPNALTFFGTQLFHLRHEQGRAGELMATMQKMVTDNPALPVFRIGISLIHAICDRREEARTSFEQVAARDFEDVPRDLHRIPMLTSAASVCAYLGDRRRAALLHEELVRHEGRVFVAGVATYWGGSIDRILGLLEETLGRLDDAISHYESAAELAAKAGAHLLHAHTSCDLARALGARAAPGDGGRAEELLARAADLYRALGVEWRLTDRSLRSARRSAPGTAPPEPPNRIVKRGTRWKIVYRGDAIELAGTKGLDYIARLVESPHRELHVLELAAPDLDPHGPRASEAGSRVTRGGDAGEVLDRRALEGYRRRLRELAAERAECERTREGGRLPALDEEVAFLEREIAAARGLGGRARRAANPVERARKAVYNRIHAALLGLQAAHPGLAVHLERSIRTGTLCSYRPEQETSWLRD